MSLGIENMHQLFFTTFIRNRVIQLSLALGIFFDFSLLQSIKHILVLFGLPYLTSIIMTYHFKPEKNKLKARVSEQYRGK